MLKSKYIPMSIGLFINFFVHGLGGVMIAQNRDFLEYQWNTDRTGSAFVISMVAIGRLSVLLVSGKLSDLFGRKLFVLLGIIVYIIGLVGMAFSPTVMIAVIFALMFGIANSFFDAGTYPALIEAFPENPSRANTLLVLFMRFGQLILPLFIVNIIIFHNIWFGWSFVLAAIILLVNGLFLSGQSFPSNMDEKVKINKDKEIKIEEVTDNSLKKSSLWSLEGICLMFYGFISMATFFIVQQLISDFAIYEANMAEESARMLLTWFSLGSILCVVVTIRLLKKISAVDLLQLYTLISLIITLVMWLFPSPNVIRIGVFIIGFSAAGGVMQIGLTVMTQMVSVEKGLATGVFLSLGSISAFMIPLITNLIEQQNLRSVMLFNAIIAAIGFLLSIIIAKHYKVMYRECGI